MCISDRPWGKGCYPWAKSGRRAAADAQGAVSGAGTRGEFGLHGDHYAARREAEDRLPAHVYGSDRGGRRQLGRGQETDLPVQRRRERGVRAGRAGLRAVHEVRQRD